MSTGHYSSGCPYCRPWAAPNPWHPYNPYRPYTPPASPYNPPQSPRPVIIPPNPFDEEKLRKIIQEELEKRFPDNPPEEGK